MTAATATCRWCGQAFTPRGSGKPQHFCSPACRRALDAAGRRYVAEALADGRLTVADPNGAAATRALPGREVCAPVAPSGAGVAITVWPATIDGLIELGLLDAARRGDPEGVALAVHLEVAISRELCRRLPGALADAALSAKLSRK